MDERRRRRRRQATLSVLLGNDPVLVEGDGLITFAANGEAVESLKVFFEPVQSGSGDPSPYNDRPISGWTGLYVYHSGVDISDYDTLSVVWSDHGTVYGGWNDLITGDLWKTWEIFDLGSATWYYLDYLDYPCFWCYQPPGITTEVWSVEQGILCSNYKAGTDVITHPSYDKVCTRVSDGRIFIRDFAYSDPAVFKSAVSGYQLCYKLASPVLVATLTPQTLDLLQGVNNIWSNTGGHIELTYTPS